MHPQGSSDDAIIKCVLLGVICPVGWGHAAVGVQQDAETAHDEQGQEDEEQQHEDEGCLLLQRQVGRHVMATARRGQRTAEEALSHPGHIHAWSSRLQLFVGCVKILQGKMCSVDKTCERIQTEGLSLEIVSSVVWQMKQQTNIST